VSIGPTIIFDKSTLQSLNPDEACWLQNFYRSVITPLFFVETLADLEKETKSGRSPEDVVGNIANKTPFLGAMPNVHHTHLCTGDLLGFPVKMQHVPVIPPGRAVGSGDRSGTVYDEPPEMGALRRWQDGEFLDVERRFARQWRLALASLDLEGVYELFRRVGAGQERVTNLAEAKRRAEDLVIGRGRRYKVLQTCLNLAGVPLELHAGIIQRWKAAGGPSLPDFAPYAAHVLTVDLFFYLALAGDLIARTRPSNRVDIAYLYYLPFCMVFTSSDKLHQRTASLFLMDGQTFVGGDDLKSDLRKLDEHYASLPEEVKRQGVLRFAPHPPLDGDFLTSRLWDQFLPGWKEQESHPIKLSREQERQLVEHLNSLRRGETPQETAEKGGVKVSRFTTFRREVRPVIGKWRLFPPDVDK